MKIKNEELENIKIGWLFIFLIFIGASLSGQINFGKYTISRSIGQSMCPTMGVYSLSIIKNKENNFKIGDIAVYKSQYYNRFVNHRIIDKFENFYEFMGDGNSFPDPIWVPKRDIIGKTIYNFDFKKCEVEE